MVALFIGIVLLTVFLSFSLYHSRSFSVLTNMIEMDQANRIALDRMTRDVRQVNCVSYYGTNWIQFVDGDGLPLTYTYSPTSRTFTRTKGASSTVLLRECDSLAFNMMQRNIVDGSYAYYPADSTNECKVMGLTWACSRTILGKKTTITGSQTARVVIRKQ